MAKNILNIIKPKQLTNPIQKKVMVEFMERHPDFARGLLKDAQGRNRKAMLWTQLSKILNSNGPPNKTVVEWRKVWQDHKWAVKRKLNFNKKELKKTGGGPCQLKEISNMEEATSRSAGLEATVKGLNCQHFGARLSESSKNNNIELEYPPEVAEDYEIIQMSQELTKIQIDKENRDVSERNETANNQDQQTGPTNKFELLKKSLEVNEKLLGSFQNIEKYLYTLQEDNKTIIDLKKKKLAVLKETNILKKQNLLDKKYSK